MSALPRGQTTNIRRAGKPRLTDNVLRGLSAVLAAAYAGDMLSGDLADDAEAVGAAHTWVTRMLAHREAAARARRQERA